MNSADVAIIESIRKRDKKTLLRFYRQHHAKIHHFIRRQIRDEATAEELVQDTFYDFIEAVRDFRGDSSPVTFLFGIARHKVIDHIRKKKVKQIFFSALPQRVVEGLATFVMDDELEKKELASKIKHSLAGLPNDYRVVLRLKYMDGERVKAIAGKLALPFKATESLIFRARKAFMRTFSSLP